jgi:hypothetical protein
VILELSPIPRISRDVGDAATACQQPMVVGKRYAGLLFRQLTAPGDLDANVLTTAARAVPPLFHLRVGVDARAESSRAASYRSRDAMVTLVVAPADAGDVAPAMPIALVRRTARCISTCPRGLSYMPE